MKISRILVPTDFSESAEQAVVAAGKLSGSFWIDRRSHACGANDEVFSRFYGPFGSALFY